MPVNGLIYGGQQRADLGAADTACNDGDVCHASLLSLLPWELHIHALSEP